MSEYFDPYTFDYKTYVKKTYGLSEMPIRLSPVSDTEIDFIDNSYDAMQVEKKGKLIDRLKHGNENLRVFEEKEGNRVWISILSEDKPLIVAEHVYQRISTPIKGIVNLGILRFKTYRMVIWRWFDERIIPNESVIVSDKAQTEKGFNFWKRMYQEYVDNQHTHEMYVIDFDTGEKVKTLQSVDELGEFYQSQNTSKFRFVLQKL